MLFNVFNQTEYSLLKSILRIESLVSYAKKNNIKELFIADENLGGIVHFLNACKNNDVIAHIGLTIEIDLFSKKNMIILFPYSQIGYENLLQINYLKNIQKLNSNNIFELLQDIIIIFKIENNFLKSTDQVYTFFEYLSSIKKDLKLLFVGVDANFGKQSLEMQFMQKLRENNINLLLAQRVLCLSNNDIPLLKTYHQINNSILTDYCSFEQVINYNVLHDINSDLNLGQKEFKKRLNNFELRIKTNKLPIFCDNSKEYLQDLAITGLAKRLSTKKIPKNYMERLLYELKTIDDLGFNDYFLITFDFIRYARKNNISVGPGRGSSVGSLVAYSIGITMVDPIVNSLYFERFLNPLRKTMPDIDVDFEDQRKDEVIKYLISKYGENHVMQIATYATFGFRSIVRDIARVNNYSEKLIKDSISRYEANDIDDSYQESKDLINLAINYLDLPRHSSTHASGIIISQSDLTQSIPYTKGSLGYQSELDGSSLENIGITKLDFLSLSNLTFIKEIVSLIKESRPSFDLSQISYTDQNTFSLLGRGESDDVFQLESQGMKKILKQFKPKELKDLYLVLAMYRPGPINSTQLILDSKNKGASANNIKILDPILNETYGVPVYQEQIMQIALVYANFSLSEADLLRRAISKKDQASMENAKEEFFKRSKDLGRDNDEIALVFGLIERFAQYGFNKSHSASYSIISYQLAYLKANYFLEFVIAKLNQLSSLNIDSMKYLAELVINGTKLRMPNIIYSTDSFFIDNNQCLVFPLNLIKTISKSDAKIIRSTILQCSKLDFVTIIHSLSQVTTQELLISLVLAGAFRDFEYTSKSMVSYINGLDFFKHQKGPYLFSEDEYNMLELKQYEKEYLGFNYKYRDYANSYLKTNNKLKLKAKITNIKNIKYGANSSFTIINVNDDFLEFEIICSQKREVLIQKLQIGKIYLFELLYTNKSLELLSLGNEK